MFQAHKISSCYKIRPFGLWSKPVISRTLSGIRISFRNLFGELLGKRIWSEIPLRIFPKYSMQDSSLHSLWYYSLDYYRTQFFPAISTKVLPGIYLRIFPGGLQEGFFSGFLQKILLRFNPRFSRIRSQSSFWDLPVSSGISDSCSRNYDQSSFWDLWKTFSRGILGRIALKFFQILSRYNPESFRRSLYTFLKVPSGITLFEFSGKSFPQFLSVFVSRFL